MLEGVHRYPWGYWFKAGKGHFLFCLLFIFSLLIIPLYIIYYNLRSFSSRDPIMKYQVLLALAMLIGDLGAIDFLPNYGFDIYPLGSIFAAISFLLITVILFRNRVSHGSQLLAVGTK